ncbi:hypothetical protein B0H63DRAFT_14817 [Podospora didyma]|uniref:Nephrocystin 3-like N-terminal domain-containing protein n=1 Tax=Podospora didyma TaxID=330526 RepID=A0AAE0U6Z7_9PEZI|nr:hypothetical protein B0H63DRAFT_14817 [Podospora didyma]
MPKALKEEHVPESWKRWRERGQSQQVLDVTTADINVPVDIIAVQGLGSTYEWTWNKELSDGSSVMWLRELLPKDLPDARIMTFEYDSRWLRDSALVTLEDCGNRLLESVIWDRTHRDSELMCPIMARRPVILLGHSFGGLVIKQALVTAATAEKEDPKYADYQSFITAVAGVMFLGTPHKGSSFASAGLMQANFSKFLGQTPNLDILKPLVIDSTLEVLPGLEKSFQYLLDYNDRLSKLLTAYFYENKPLRFGPFKTKLVVEKDSACYGSRAPVQQVELDASHMEMNKFGSRDESNYQRLVRRLANFHDQAGQIAEARLGRHQYDTDHPGGDVMEIRHWLSPEIILNCVYERRQADRLDGTCEWADDVDIIRTWLGMDSLPPAPSSRASAEGHTVWVSGKAGSGKSVFAAYIYDRIFEAHRGNNWSATDVARCSGSSETVDCQHYSVISNKAVLYAPISKTSTSASIIRTWIHQLLSFQPTRSRLQRIVIDAKKGLEECTSRQGSKILRNLLKYFPLTHIIVDGLDECEKPRDIVDLFKDISKQPNVRILFLARQDEELEHMALRGIPRLQMVNITDYNSSDILSFIQNAVSELALVNNAVAADAPTVVERISRDARGMFQWAHLVLYELHFAKTRDDVLRTMERFPHGLNEAYAKTFHRLSQAPAFEPDILALVFKLLTASYRPLTWEDLAMAVQLQKELDSRRRLDVQSLQECINDAVEKTRQLPANYFAFLGPLVDIRQSAANNSRAADPGTTASRPTRTVALCHHSLYQWIDGSEKSVDSAAPWWKHMHFTRAQADVTLSGLSLAMISSKLTLSAHLQDFYSTCRSTTPFLNYSGEYWFAHLRAVGASANLPRLTAAAQRDVNVSLIPLSNLVEMVLNNSMDLAAGVCAALASSLGAVSMDKVSSLSKVMALRGLESALLPASQSIASVKKALPQLFEVDQESQFQTTAMTRNQQDSTAHDTSRALGPKLDSEIALHILAMIQRWGTDAKGANSSKQLSRKRHIELLCQAARNIRRLAILVAVDPVRGWIYAQTGDSGISPLAALAHTSEAIDTFLASLLLAPEPLSSYDMADQFNTQVGHPYHGLVSAARYELATRQYDGFNSEFYREHIMEHYRISKWEWSTMRVFLAAMEMSSANSYHMHTVLRGWVAQHRLSHNKDDSSTAVVVVSNLRFQNFSSRAITLKESVGLLMSATAAFLFKYLTYVCPSLENVFLTMRGNFLFITGFLRPTLGYLFANLNDFLVGFCIYLVRCRYAPWVFPSPRTTPWTDLKGVIENPEGYIPDSSSPLGVGWIPYIIYLVQGMLLLLLTMIDTVNYLDSETGDALTKSLHRRTSFRLGFTSDGTPPILRKVERSLETYGFYWFSNFRRIVVIEWIILTLSYWVFDLIRSAAVAVASALWSWKSAITYGFQLVGYSYGRTAGFFEVAKLYARFHFWVYLLARYRDTSLAGYLYRYVLLPASTFLWDLLRWPMQAVAARRDDFLALLGFLEGLMVHAIKQVDTRTLIFSTAFGIPCFGLLFWYVLSDPLGLDSAARSCAKAGRVSRELTGIEDPAGFLEWKGASHADPNAIIAFTGTLEDLEEI